MPMLSANNANFYVETHGEGQPLVLIAGYTGDHLYFTPVLNILKQHFQVVLIDNRGVGQTEDDNSVLSSKLMADDVIAICDALELKKPHILGHSMGGTIAQMVGIHHGDKIGKLILSATSAKWRQAMVRGFKGMLELRRQDVDFDIQFELILGWVFGEKFLQNEDMVAFIKDAILNAPYPQSFENQARQFEVLATHDAKALVQNITSETLVMYGEEDVIASPDEAVFLANEINQAELTSLPCGHGFFVEATEQVSNTIIEFLTRS